MGRTNIEIVAKTIQEQYRGQLVYGDTVSFFNFTLIKKIIKKIYFIFL
jgi:hypothetical protein